MHETHRAEKKGQQLAQSVELNIMKCHTLRLVYESSATTHNVVALQAIKSVGETAGISR